MNHLVLLELSCWGRGGHTPFWNHSVRWTTLYFWNHPVGQRGVTPHSEIIMRDGPPCFLEGYSNTPHSKILVGLGNQALYFFKSPCRVQNCKFAIPCRRSLNKVCSCFVTPNLERIGCTVRSVWRVVRFFLIPGFESGFEPKPGRFGFYLTIYYCTIERQKSKKNIVPSLP